MQFKHNPLCDIRPNLCDNFPLEDLKSLYGLDVSPRVNETDYCNYKYCLSINGYVSAWRRPAEIMYAGSVLLMQHSYKQYFYDYLINHHNYIRVNHDFSNLEDTIIYLNNHPRVAESIAKRGHELAIKLFNRAAIAEALRRACESP